LESQSDVVRRALLQFQREHAQGSAA
jgi:Arc/MetJ-type ribon-helix-helix transcriptional regulator